MSKILRLLDGTEIIVLPLEGRLSNIMATFSNIESAIMFYHKLVKENLSSIALIDDDNTKIYTNRCFGSFTFETAPDSSDIRIRFSLVPPSAPSIGVDNTAELDALRAENTLLKTENEALTVKAQGYDIITKGE